jgi:hypothetical protein
MTNVFRRTLALTLSLLAAAVASEAAAVRAGSTLAAIEAISRGSAVAYDSINNVYLVVSAQGTVRGRFVDASGTPIGAAFQIQAGLNFGAFPRVAFSPDANGGAGGFLVTWSESDLPSNASLHGRMVAFGQNGAYGLDRQLSVDGNWWEEGPYIAYSTASDEFLVVYRTFPTYIVRAVRVGVDGAAKDVPLTVSQTGQFEDNPSVAYNAVTNQFLVCWKGYNDPGRFGFVDCQLVQSGASQIVGGPFRLTASAATYITDTTYNPTTNQYFVTWDNGTGIFGRIVNADGSLPGSVIPVSTLWHAYDALSVGYNRVSRTFFMVSHDARACVSCDDGGVEIADSGTPIDNGFLVTQTGAKGSFYPSIAASDNEPKWLVTTAADFKLTAVQLVAGTAAGSAPPPPPTAPTPPPPPPPPPPPAPVSRPIFNIDTPSNNATVPSTGFLISGWAVDVGATSGTGIDVVVCWAYPKSGAPAILAGIASYGHPRPDIGAWLGNGFTPSGYGLLGVLPPGAYTLAIYAHSTVDGGWGTPKLMDATVEAPVSNPRMHIDLPAQNQTLSQNVLIAGWSLDLASAAGPGVDTLHIYAYPVGSSTPVWLGVATYGHARPDVGAAFGSPRFTNSGFSLLTTLAPGDYTIVVFSHSAVTNTFNNAATVTVRVL